MKENKDTGLREHRLLYGTNTSNAAQNYIQIAGLDLPQLHKTVADPDKYNEQTGEVGGHGASPTAFTWRNIQRINHPTEVNKARYMPQNINLIGSMAADGKVYLFDRTKHPLQPAGNTPRPELELSGHTEEGFAMSWSWKNEGMLVTGAEDHKVHVW